MMHRRCEVTHRYADLMVVLPVAAQSLDDLLSLTSVA
jgi:hypothetical protein